jgi:hypothetical protein
MPGPLGHERDHFGGEAFGALIPVPTAVPPRASSTELGSTRSSRSMPSIWAAYPPNSWPR